MTERSLSYQLPNHNVLAPAAALALAMTLSACTGGGHDTGPGRTAATSPELTATQQHARDIGQMLVRGVEQGTIAPGAAVDVILPEHAAFSELRVSRDDGDTEYLVRVQIPVGINSVGEMRQANVAADDISAMMWEVNSCKPEFAVRRSTQCRPLETGKIDTLPMTGRATYDDPQDLDKVYQHITG